jgi:Arc/MetJ-type ribon-helix-helix transcriptional regulator
MDSEEENLTVAKLLTSYQAERIDTLSSLDHTEYDSRAEFVRQAVDELLDEEILQAGIESVED